MLIPKHFIALLFITTFAVSSCIKKTDENITPEPKAEVLNCAPYSDITLTDHNPNGVDYIISCELISRGSIYINPGVTIMMKSGAGLRINGTLRAEGTATNPIIIKGESDVRGYWKNVILSSNNNNNVMRYCNISNGGGATITDIPANYNANLIVFEGAGLIMANCIVEKSNALGIYAESGTTDRTFLTFSNNILRQNALAPIQTQPSNITAIETNNIFENNDVSYIEILGGYITGNNTWKAQSIPYLCKGGVVLSGSNSDNLTVNGGVEIIFLSNASLSTLKNSACYMNFNGTASQRINLHGILPVKGTWGGVCIQTGNILNSIKYTDISDGGALYFGTHNNTRANLSIGGDTYGRCVVANSSFTNSQNCGIGIAFYSTTPDAFYVDGGNNTFANNGNSNNICR